MPAFNSFCIAYIQYLALHTSYWLLIVLSLGLLDNRISFTFPFHALDLCGITHILGSQETEQSHIIKASGSLWWLQSKLYLELEKGKNWAITGTMSSSSRKNDYFVHELIKKIKVLHASLFIVSTASALKWTFNYFPLKIVLK